MSRPRRRSPARRSTPPITTATGCCTRYSWAHPLPPAGCPASIPYRGGPADAPPTTIDEMTNSPEHVAAAIIRAAEADDPPRRLVLGSDAWTLITQGLRAGSSRSCASPASFGDDADSGESVSHAVSWQTNTARFEYCTSASCLGSGALTVGWSLHHDDHFSAGFPCLHDSVCFVNLVEGENA